MTEEQLAALEHAEQPTRKAVAELVAEYRWLKAGLTRLEGQVTELRAENLRNRAEVDQIRASIDEPWLRSDDEADDSPTPEEPTP